MTKSWVYQYGDTTIEVKNSWINGCALYVNGKLQDKEMAVGPINIIVHIIVQIFEPEYVLEGKLETGEEIRAKLGGIVLQCMVRVDHQVLTPLPKAPKTSRKARGGT
jgi:hypothetical protein